jgi:hypothetical protein
VGSPPKSLQFPGAPPPARTAEVEADVEEPAGVGATKELPLAGENVMKVMRTPLYVRNLETCIPFTNTKHQLPPNDYLSSPTVIKGYQFKTLPTKRVG